MEQDILAKRSIKKWVEEERPREKMLIKGVDALTDAELLALLIQNGTKSRSAVDLARELLHLAQYDFNKMAKWQSNQFQKVKGIGNAKATLIMAALEIGRRRQSGESDQNQKITTSKMAADILFPLLQDFDHERFYIILMNKSNIIIHKENISVGGIDSTTVDVRIILKLALEHLATGIILAHNHPSGNPLPSNIDKTLTTQIQMAASLLEIKLIDHIIIAKQKYYSFKDEDLI